MGATQVRVDRSERSDIHPAFELSPRGEILDQGGLLGPERMAPNASANPMSMSPQTSMALDLRTNGLQPTALQGASTTDLAMPQPVEALPQQVELLATRGGGTARIRLHPGELGDVDITVSLRGEAVDVVIHAEEPAARAAVLHHREHLVEALGARELRMEGFDVSGGGRGPTADDRQAAWNGPEDRPGQQESGFASQPRNTQVAGIETRSVARRDFYQREGIDLRI